MCFFFDLKYKKRCFYIYAFLFCFYVLYGREETVLKECLLKKKASFMYTLAIYLCFVLLFHWIYFILLMHQPL